MEVIAKLHDEVTEHIAEARRSMHALAAMRDPRFRI